jgi:cell division protein ZapE
MILSRLFEAIWKDGCTVVATSNRAPDALYENGLNRALFLPFIKTMPEHLEIHHFDGDADHRLRALTAAPVYYTPLGEATDAEIEAAWARLIGEADSKPTTLRVQGRDLLLRRTAAGVARTSFARLCEQPLGSADYLGLAQSFQTLILEGVPVMSAADRNAAKRFVTLIDALYETRTKLILSAEAEPEGLYAKGDGSFEFERTVSRLMEMRTEEYLSERRMI